MSLKMRVVSGLKMCIICMFFVFFISATLSLKDKKSSTYFRRLENSFNRTQRDIFALSDRATVISNLNSRFRREYVYENNNNESSEETTFEKEEIGWSKINEEVDVVIPMVLQHLQDIGVEYLQLPPLKESINLSPFFIVYEVGLFLSNGIVYNIAGIQRYGDAFMTYEDKSFSTRFFLMIRNLQFEYNFLLKLTPIEGYGKVIGSLDDTIIYAELAVNISSFSLKLNDFRIISFRNINVQLDQVRIIRELTGLILSPITNLFRDRITTSISDGMKDQMQTLMTDFNERDPLELRSFSKKLLAGLTGISKQ